MEKNIPSFPEELVQQARNCLEENDSELDAMTDSGRLNYRTARIITLAKYLQIGLPQAEKLLKQVDDNKPSGSSEQVRRVASLVNGIQEDPYKVLVEQLTFAYDCFRQEHGIDTGAPLPEDLKQTAIFEFSEIGGAKQQVPLWLAHFLLKPNAKMDCREFFVSATRGRML